MLLHLISFGLLLATIGFAVSVSMTKQHSFHVIRNMSSFVFAVITVIFLVIFLWVQTP